MVRNILGAVSQFQKDEQVAKLRKARGRKRKETGRCEDPKGLSVTNPEMVKEAWRLRRKNPVSGKRRSYRVISAVLASMGHVRPTGEPYSAMTIRNITTR